MFKTLRVPERAKGHVNQWQIAIVEGVKPPRMMDIMALGALNDKAKPAGRLDIHVLENGQEHGDQ